MYNDLDGNGMQDIFSGEFGLQGWTVRLSTATGVFYAETTTDETGWYEIPNVGNTAWSVCLVLQSGFRLTASTSGTMCASFTATGTIGTWYPNDFGVTQ